MLYRCGRFFGDLVLEQNHQCVPVDGDQTGPYLDKTVTIDWFWNKVAMFHFEAEKGAAAILSITRLTPDKSFSWGFIGIDNNLYRLGDFLTGSDTIFVKDVALGHNNHVFVHLFGEDGASLRIQVLPPLPTITDFTISPGWVAPEATTVYTLTAGNAYGSISASVTLEVLFAPQLSIIEPDSLDDAADGSFTIVWTDEDPDSNAEISLYYDTDNVGADGTGDQYVWDTASLAPGEYYIYGVIDDGRNAAVISYSSAPVIVPAATPPVVSISADPASITNGGSTTLAWTSTEADTCVIEPEIGSVATTGSVLVSPEVTTTYTITATGLGGTVFDSVMVQVDCPLHITITSPADGDNVSGISIPVIGTVTHAAGIETGVIVNGMQALINGNQFRADYVYLRKGENLITALATDANGITASASVTVDAADTSGDYIILTADPVSGIPPFETTLRIEGSLDVFTSDLTYDGPGTVEFLESDFDKYKVKLSTEGIYSFTATVTDYQGNVYTSAVTVEVLDQAALDELLQGKWAGMKAALLAGNVDQAMQYFAHSSRESFSQQFNAEPALLPQIVGDMGDIRFVKSRENRAIYDMRVVHDGTEYSFQVLFILDEDAIWRIRSF